VSQTTGCQVDIGANLSQVQERIQTAARRVGRDAAEVSLIAVTKTHPVEVVQAAYQAGVRHLGENRVEEARLKIPAFDEWLAASSPAAQRPVWHMIGHLQSRKAADALAYFDTVHSVDSFKLAERLNRLADPAAGGRLFPILLECNVSGEASKHGFALSRWRPAERDWRDDREVWAAFLETVRRIAELPRLHLQGLMTMAPLVSDPEQARPTFAALRYLRDALTEAFPTVEWRHLSMGMTDDFEVAVEEGATLLRIGRAIFGPRH
jgi:pyridoxal phosphate enzyme (YggS family)